VARWTRTTRWRRPASLPLANAYTQLEPRGFEPLTSAVQRRIL
jgi:hypothetical protein